MSIETHAHLSNVAAFVAGKQVNVHAMILEQDTFSHHKLELTLDYDALGYDFLSDVNKQIQWMGEIVTVEIKQGTGKYLYIFEGMIDGVSLRGGNGKHGFVVLHGSSLTRKLERGKRMDVFCELPLRSVVSDITKDTGIKLENNPEHHLNVAYLMQYNETDWEFLQRLAVIAGENLYYTGRKLVFGTIPDEGNITARYNEEITDLEFFSQLRANSFHTYSYTYELDDSLERNSPARLRDMSLFVQTAMEKGAMLTTDKRPDVPTPLYIESIAPVQEYNARRKAATAANTIGVRGKANAPVAHIGKLLTIEGKLAMGIGKYRITKVRHIYDQVHHYSCEFEGCAGELSNVPQPELKMPVASSLRGTVLSNEDPQGWGRVQVDFEFAKTRPCDTWMRVMSPDAGKSDVVATNRGMVFVPEKGDQVMVNFEFGDPNRPFVMGSMFHAKNTVGGGADNHIKSIRTRSGHTIEFDDAKATLGITIKDKSGNFIHINSKDNNIEITALDTITMKARDIRLEASNNIEMEAEANVKVDALNILHIGAQGNIDMVTESDMQIKSMANTSIVSQSEIQIEGFSIKASSDSEMTIEGIDTKIKGQKSTISGSGHKMEIM